MPQSSPTRLTRPFRTIILVCSCATASFGEAVSRVTYRGSLGGEAAGIATDSAGASIVAKTVQHSKDVSPDPIHHRFAPVWDTQIQKVSSDGAVTWLTWIRDTQAAAVAIDANGDIYACGRSSTGEPSPVVKLNPQGQVKWIHRVKAFPYGLAVDREGGVWITGDATGSFQPTTGGLQTALRSSCRAAVPGAPVSCKDAFVARVSPDGSTLQYATFFGGSGDDVGNAIALDGQGRVWVAGASASKDLPVTQNAYQGAFGGGPPSGQSAPESDGFLIALDVAGARLVYSTYLGGARYDTVTGLAATNQDVFLTGVSHSADFPVTPPAPRDCRPDPVQPNACSGAFYASFRSTGDALYVSRHDSGRVSGPVLDRRGSLWFAGTSSGGACRPNAFVVTLDPATGRVTESQPVMFISSGRSPGLAIDVGGIVHLIGEGIDDQLGGRSYSGAMLQLLDYTRNDEFEPQCMVNAATSGYGVNGSPMWLAPGELISIRGVGLGPSAKVRLGERELAVLSSTPDEILAAIPPDMPSGSSYYDAVPTSLTVERGPYSGAYEVRVGPLFPGIFTVDQAHAAVLNEDGTVNSLERPARRGSVISVFATGLGRLDAAGRIARPYELYIEASTPTNAAGMEVLYGGLAPGMPGVYQLNARVPTLAKTGERGISIVFTDPERPNYLPWYCSSQPFPYPTVFLQP